MRLRKLNNKQSFLPLTNKSTKTSPPESCDKSKTDFVTFIIFLNEVLLKI